MLHRKRRRTVTLAFAVFLLVPWLWPGTSHARPFAAGPLSAEAAAALDSVAWSWRTLFSYWLPLAGPGGSPRHHSPAGRAGFGRTLACDAGASLDPNGRCAQGSVRRPVLLPTCDAGPSLDPSGRCVHRTLRRPILLPTCDEGPSLDPNGRCAAH